MKQSFVFSGSGGQGIMSAGIMLAHAAIDEAKHATYLPEYGPEQRGGSAKCTVIISDGEIISPLTKKCDNLICMNEQSYRKFAGDLKSGGLLVINSSRVKGEEIREDVRVLSVPVDDIALELGNVRVANIVLIGALMGATDIVSKEVFVRSLEEKFKAKKPEILELNIKALEEGIALTNDEGLKKMLEEISTVDEVKEESADVSSPEAEAAPDVESVSILSQLNGEEVKKLNMFLSNFSEAQFEDYSQDAYSNAQLIRYSFIHNFINNDSKIQWTESSMGISSIDVNNDAQRFFGKVVPLESTGDWNYANGTFYTPAAMGESYAYFSIVTDVRDSGNGIFDVEFSVFFDSNNSYEVALPQWYSYSISQAKYSCMLVGNVTSKLRAKTYNGNNTYELLEYNVE